LARFNSGGASGGGAPPVVPILELLDRHEAAAPEATYTFTPAVALDSDTYSKIIVIINFQSTASFILQGLINGLATLYSSQRVRVNVGVVSGLSQVATTSWELASATLNQFAGADVAVELEFYLGTDAFPTNERQGGFVKAMCFDVVEQGGLYQNTIPTTEISSITIQAASSTWRVGSTIITYGVRI